MERRETETEAAARRSTILIRGLTKRYGDFEAVTGLDLEVSAGEVFAFLGPNGAGKTTTIRMLMGILQPSAGTAAVEGHDCFRDRVEVKRIVGYLPDDPVFYDYLKGGEILRFVAEMHGLEGDEATRRIGAMVERLDLADAIEDYAVNYSRGMKKKLALACALLHRPRVLILDEPTSGLDPRATRTMHDLMRERAEAGDTIFYSTHLLDHAERMSHRAGIVFKGRLAAVGTLSDLRSSLAAGGSLEEVFFAVTRGAEDEPAVSPPRGVGVDAGDRTGTGSTEA